MTRETSQAGAEAHPQVFISYAREDTELVIAIARLLEQDGITVWRDGDRILGGQSWGTAIVHGIAHSEIFMLMCSAHSLHSRAVQHEVWLAWDHQRPYLPVWLSPVIDIPDKIRFPLGSDCQWINVHAEPPESWLPQVLNALRAMGVGTQKPNALNEAVAPTPEPSNRSTPAAQRGLRFKPGDRPVKGADWELDQLLGKGGFGEVWKAKHPELPGLPPVALKFCLQLDERSKALLRHEADMVLRAQQQFRTGGFANASGIVPLAHAYLNNDPPCLEYPYIEGGTLVRLIDESRQSPSPSTSAGSLKPAQVQQIVQRVAQIVSAAHRATPKLVRAKPTASGRVTRRASERCVVHSSREGIGSCFQEGPAGQEGGAYARLAKPVPCAVGAQVPLGDYIEPPRGSTGLTRENGPSVVFLTSTPPTGATPRERPPRGGHPNASACGRG
jgi:hypothetical protein